IENVERNAVAAKALQFLRDGFVLICPIRLEQDHVVVFEALLDGSDIQGGFLVDLAGNAPRRREIDENGAARGQRCLERGFRVGLPLTRSRVAGRWRGRVADLDRSPDQPTDNQRRRENAFYPHALGLKAECPQSY